MEQDKQDNPNYSIPGAIVVAGLIIAGSIYYGGRAGSTTPNNQLGAAAEGNAPTAGKNEESFNFKAMRPVSREDRILGDANAPIKIVEYSDMECPFCKSFHETMHQVMDAYPGKIAWVYRHFPLSQLHSKAPKEAAAAECAYTLGNNDIFWDYIDKVFETTPSNNNLDLTLLSKIATDVGLDQKKFEECLTNDTTAPYVAKDYQNAVDIGAQGTPFPIIITPKGETFALGGAAPFDVMKQVIDNILDDKPAN